ncbi:MAG TPA: hypothetical protein VGJ26_08030 [Pirellulales bacterium]|jgi:hypothetical protein
MSILLLSADLAISSKVTGAAARQGTPVTVAMSIDRLCELTAAATTDVLVLVDLTFPGLAIEELVPKLLSGVPSAVEIVAFGPHVHEERLAEAKRAGCHAVTSRGQFLANIDQLLMARKSPSGE